MTRLTFLVIVVTITLTGLLFAREGRSQNIGNFSVSLNHKNVKLEQILDDLEKQSGFTFTYTQKIGSLGPYSIKVDHQTLFYVLKHLADTWHLTFQQNKMLISVSRQPPPPIPPPTGSVKGRIVEFETSQPLPAASIYIVELQRGGTTDEQGYYRFANIPEGKYTFQVSYVGYKTEQAIVEVKAGKEVSYDIKLQGANTLNAVMVTGKKALSKTPVSYSREKDLVAEMHNSVGVISGISNEMIAKTADRNAAEIVKRISGVTVVDDRFVIVRGMNERYNLTYLNGNVAPSTELYNKGFAYDLLPSSIIDKILVYKSPMADLVADYSGAAIKVFTKDAVPARHIDVGVQIAHRPGSTLSTINSYTGGKYDLLGFDDGTRKLPNIPPGYFQVTQPNQQTLVNSFSPILDYGQKQSLPDMQLYLNYYDSFKLKASSRLYNLTSINYTHETRFYNVYRQTGNTYSYGLDTLSSTAQGRAVGGGSGNKITESQQTTEIGKINILENLTFKLNDHNIFKFKNFFVNEGRSQTNVDNSRPNVAPILDSLGSYKRNLNIILSFQQRLLYAGNLGGSHDFGKKNKSKLEWNLGYTYDLQNVPDQRISQFSSTTQQAGGTGLNQNGQFLASRGAESMLGLINRIFVKNSENLYNFTADYNYHISDNFSLKTGTYNLYKQRDVERRVFRVDRGGFGQGGSIYIVPNDNAAGYYYGYGLTDPNILNYRYADLANIWNANNFPSNGSGLQIYDATALSDSYLASEENHSFYGMGDWNLANNKVTVNGGLRVEYDRQKVSGAGIYNGIPYAIPVDHAKTSVLPSINIGYRPDSVFVFRGSYGRTLNRPEFREITPYSDFDYQNNEMIQGNPNVVTSIIDNYDLRAELYPHGNLQNETFNIGIFYKKLHDPIEKLRIGFSFDNPYTTIGFQNAVSAEVYGIEAELKKNLSFIGGQLFRNLSFVMNGALLKSTTIQRDLAFNYSQLGQTTPIAGRPLQGQSPYVLNTGIFYENAGLGTKLGFTYNVSGPRIYAKSLVNSNSKNQAQTQIDLQTSRPDLLELSRQLLDFSITQRIIRSLQVKASIQNLLNQSFRIVEDQNYNQKYDPEVSHRSSFNSIGKGATYYSGDNIYSSYNPGRYFVFQFTYAF